MADIGQDTNGGYIRWFFLLMTRQWTHVNCFLCRAVAPVLVCTSFHVDCRVFFPRWPAGSVGLGLEFVGNSFNRATFLTYS